MPLVCPKGVGWKNMGYLIPEVRVWLRDYWSIRSSNLHLCPHVSPTRGVGHNIDRCIIQSHMVVHYTKSHCLIFLLAWPIILTSNTHRRPLIAALSTIPAKEKSKKYSSSSWMSFDGTSSWVGNSSCKFVICNWNTSNRCLVNSAEMDSWWRWYLYKQSDLWWCHLEELLSNQGQCQSCAQTTFRLRRVRKMRSGNETRSVHLGSLWHVYITLRFAPSGVH